MSPAPRCGRPFITYEHGTVLHNGKPCRVELRSGVISVGCTDVSIEAACYLVQAHKLNFPDKDHVVVLQTGAIPS